MRAFFVRIFFQHNAIGIAEAMVVLWQLERGLSLTYVGLLVGVWRLCIVLFEVPTGYIADRFGRKTSLVLSNILYAIGYIAVGFSSTFWHFVIANVITAIAFTLFSGAQEAYVYDFLKKEKKERLYKKIWSRVSAVDEIATIIGILMASGLVYWFGFQVLFLTAGGIMFIAGVVTFFFLKNIQHIPNPENVEEVVETQPKKIVTQAWELLGRYRFLLGAFFAFALIDFPAKAMWNPQLLSVGLTASQIALAYTFLKFFSLAGSLYAGKHKGEVRSIHFVWLALVSAGVFALVAASQLWAVLLGFGIYFFIENVFRIFRSEFINQRVDSKYRATVLSAASFSGSMFGVVAIMTAGVVADISLAYVFIGMIVLKLIAAIVSSVALKGVQSI